MRFNGSVSGGVSGMMEILGEGDTVNITPTLTSGVEVATFKVNEGTAEEETIKLYAPDTIGWDKVTGKPNLFSGVYNDLTGKPTYNGEVLSGNIYTHNYSNNEHMVGVWIDGRPVYEKTIIVDLPSGAGTFDLVTLDTDIDLIVSQSAFMFLNQYIRFLPYTDIGSYDTNIYFNLPTIKLVVDNDNWSGYKLCITLQYTKSTNL